MPSATRTADPTASAIEQGPGRAPPGSGHVVDLGPCDADCAARMRRRNEERGQEPASRSLTVRRQDGSSQTTRIRPYALRRVVSCGFSQIFTDVCVCSGVQDVDFVGADVCIYPASLSPFAVVPLCKELWAP